MAQKSGSRQLSDFDPDGQEIAHSFARSLRDDFNVQNVDAVKVALTSAQVKEMCLPPILEAKKTSSSYNRFVDEHGTNVFELESVPPDDLQNILRKAIDQVIEKDRFNAELDFEKNDAAYLADVRREVHQYLSSLPELAGGKS